MVAATPWQISQTPPHILEKQKNKHHRTIYIHTAHKICRLNVINFLSFESQLRRIKNQQRRGNRPQSNVNLFSHWLCIQDDKYIMEPFRDESLFICFGCAWFLHLFRFLFFFFVVRISSFRFSVAAFDGRQSTWYFISIYLARATIGRKKKNRILQLYWLTTRYNNK